MIDREKLTKLLSEIVTPYWVNVLVDHLLSNGVTFPKKAHWIIDRGCDWGECSQCHEASKLSVMEHKDYCPACGAIMDEESVVVRP